MMELQHLSKKILTSLTTIFYLTKKVNLVTVLLKKSKHFRLLKYFCKKKYRKSIQFLYKFKK